MSVKTYKKVKDGIDILIEKAEFALYCDFCRILQVIQWNV